MFVVCWFASAIHNALYICCVVVSCSEQGINFLNDQILNQLGISWNQEFRLFCLAGLILVLKMGCKPLKVTCRQTLTKNDFILFLCFKNEILVDFQSFKWAASYFQIEMEISEEFAPSGEKMLRKLILCAFCCQQIKQIKNHNG